MPHFLGCQKENISGILEAYPFTLQRYNSSSLKVHLIKPYALQGRRKPPETGWAQNFSTYELFKQNYVVFVV